MSRLYGPNHRALQDRFDLRRLADNVEKRVLVTEITAEHKAFIESRDMFWLATIDHEGRPTVSYKGGEPGFVRVLDGKTLAFPCYDGNGMFYSMGNLVGNDKVGLLFLNFEQPHRIRVQGIASVDHNDPLLADYAEAQLVVRVGVTEIFRNCPRYVHRYRKVAESEYVPHPGSTAPLAAWKRVDDVQTSLSKADQDRVAREGGLITRAEYEKYMAHVSDGDKGFFEPTTSRRLPCRALVHPPPTSARLFISFTRPVASSFPIHGTSAARAICKVLASRRLATTSSGHAHAQGFADGAQSRDDVLAHYRELAAATDIPLNADFENGFADDPAGVADNVTRCITTGVAGLSIEDSPNNSTTPLYDFDLSVARVKAARAAIDRAGGDVVLTARAENFIRGVPDLDDAIRRLKAYAVAGADCLYAPGIKTREQIEAVVKAVAPKPVNFLNSGAYGFTVDDIAAMGVRRISVGGSLARVAMHAFIRVATEIAKDGKFDGFAGLISNPELNKFFSEDRKKFSS